MCVPLTSRLEEVGPSPAQPTKKGCYPDAALKLRRFYLNGSKHSSGILQRCCRDAAETLQRCCRDAAEVAFFCGTWEVVTSSHQLIVAQVGVDWEQKNTMVLCGRVRITSCKAKSGQWFREISFQEELSSSRTSGVCTRKDGKLHKARSRLHKRRFLKVNLSKRI